MSEPETEDELHDQFFNGDWDVNGYQDYDNSAFDFADNTSDDEVLALTLAYYDGNGSDCTDTTASSYQENDSISDDEVLAIPLSNSIGDEKVPNYTDTTVLSKSDLVQDIMYQSGCLHLLKHKVKKALSSTARFLAWKDFGIFTKAQNISSGQKAAIFSHFIPGNKEPQALMSQNDKLFCGIYSQHGDTFTSAGQDGLIRIYDCLLGRWKCIKTVMGKDVGWSILDVEYSHEGNHLIYSSWCESVHIISTRDDSDLHEALSLPPVEPYNTAAFSIKFSPDDTEVLAGANMGWLYIYNRQVNKTVKIMSAHADDVNAVCFADDSGHLLYSGGEDGLIKVWDRRCLREDNSTPVGVLAGHYDAIVFLDSKNDARHLISNSKDQSIKLWDIRNFASKEGVASSLKAVSAQYWDYQWDTYGSNVVKDKLPGDCSLMTYYGHSVGCTLIRARFSPSHSTNQRFIYCGDARGHVIIYDIITGNIVRDIKPGIIGRRSFGHRSDIVRDVSWHPYEPKIISSGWDGNLICWNPHVN